MITGIPEQWVPFTTGFLLILFRVGAVVSMMPALGEASIPVRIKLAIALSFTMLIFPVILPSGSVTIGGPINLFGLILLEVGVGLVLGLLLRVFLFCLQIAGSIAAQSTSLSQILGMAGVEPLPAMGHVITMAGLTLAMMLGLHVSAAQFIIVSYMWLPVGQMPDLGTLAEVGRDQIAFGFKLAFTLAAPFYILSVLYNLTLGVINRAMPQLMVAFVGAPVITAGALLVLAVSLPLVLTTWSGAFFAFMSTFGMP